MNDPYEQGLPSDCRAARGRVQDAWDLGHPVPDPETAAHLSDCPDCRGWCHLVTRVEAALHDQPAPTPDIQMTTRIAAAVRLDRSVSLRRRRVRAAGIFALAASLLVAVYLLTPSDDGVPEVVRTPPERPQPKEPILPEGDPADFASLEEGLARVTSAVASRVRQTAGETAIRTKDILALSADELPPLEQLARAGDEANSLEGLSSGASAAFSPVSKSTRKAFSLAFGSYMPPPDRTPE